MNELSWLIYWADVVDGISGVFAATSFILGLFGAAALFAVAMAFDGKIGKLWWAGLTAYLLVVPICAAISVFIPSSKAIYMIAASEAGEAVVTSPEAKEMLSDLKEIIRRQLKKELGGGAEI